MNGSSETKSEIRARMGELQNLLDGFKPVSDSPIASYMDSESLHDMKKQIQDRIDTLSKDLEIAQEDLSSSIIRSHRALCEVKKMDERAAYGNDPAVYYTLGVCGEAGEMANAIVKSLRNGATRAPILEAVKSELPDVIIYSFVLAHVLDIDLAKLVNEKVNIVVQRAHDGYYGGPLASDVPGSIL